MCLLSAHAYDYQHSVGGTVGSMYGVTYKGFFAPIGNNGAIGVIGDLGVHLLSTFGPRHEVWLPDNSYYYTSTYSFFTFELNPNVVYQSEIAEFDTGRVDWYAGIGASTGLASGFDYHNTLAGKFGTNVIGGAEVIFDVPVNISLDFRPGYGLWFNSDHHMSYFDWAIAASVRYRF